MDNYQQSELLRRYALGELSHVSEDNFLGLLKATNMIHDEGLARSWFKDKFGAVLEEGKVVPISDFKKEFNCLANFRPTEELAELFSTNAINALDSDGDDFVSVPERDNFANSFLKKMADDKVALSASMLMDFVDKIQRFGSRSIKAEDGGLQLKDELKGIVRSQDVNKDGIMTTSELFTIRPPEFYLSIDKSPSGGKGLG